MNMIYKVFIFIIFTSCLICSCGKNSHSKVETILNRADSIMEAFPDSAYRILISYSDSVDSYETSDRMRFNILMAEACNKLYKQLPSDTILNDAIDYYDRHGNSNQLMKAHYLLGCRYRDDGNSPSALKQYQEAVECADTLSSDCDYTALALIYSQMAELFHNQYLPEKSIDAERKFSHFSLKAGNIYYYIRGIELQMEPYLVLKDTAMILSLTDSVYNLYKKYGMSDKAARVFLAAINIHIHSGNYKEAKRMMDEFELKSGLFDRNGEIDSQYGYYYYLKGLFCLHEDDVISAEDYFRKALKIGYIYEACCGLTSIYRAKENIDSVSYYTQKSEKYIDETLSHCLQVQISVCFDLTCKLYF